MVRHELESRVHNTLNRTAHISEATSNVMFVVAGLVSAVDVLRRKSPKDTVLKGALVALAVRSLSAVCDLGVDAINNRNGLT